MGSFKPAFLSALYEEAEQQVRKERKKKLKSTTDGRKGEEMRWGERKNRDTKRKEANNATHAGSIENLVAYVLSRAMYPEEK